ncbi:cadherin-23-like [Venturia canescens]|uniref:cadherin-23-like n=1 Tax=Venturia canescens TaxID=32260 RepID=UPI001C9CB302|nr:cadherin-23-like [Venturia canescens]XP_043281416.1 cadherin-23-like [Venturia canescens]XP_043281423.1 cadherin-23-like [Venturia canescens]XP_043281431.1 cadherin-23-like [Venturia canescens]
MAFPLKIALLMVYLSVPMKTVRGDSASYSIVAPDPKDEAVQFNFDAAKKRADIELDEELDHPVCVAVLNYTDVTAPEIGAFKDDKSNYVLGAEFKQDNATKRWSLWINNKQDYEQEEMREYLVPVYVSNQPFLIALHIQNIDDNPPVIQAVEKNCKIKENFKGPSNCSYIIKDADGSIDQVKITLSPESERKYFQLIPSADEKSNYELKAVLHVNESLDFETTSIHMLEIQAIDTGGHKGTLDVVVSVIDVADQPPVWTRIIPVVYMSEKSIHRFNVSAIDGDFQINAVINYAITISEEGDENLFVVDKETGVITIHEIDRDKRKQEIFHFLITAYEKMDPPSNISQNIFVILEDLNDHSPEITPDSLNITIDEETYRTLEFNQPIEIQDPDLAENAQFSVSLVDTSKHNWSSAFAVLPTTGYQKGVFTISVSNASLLDYENPDWQNIRIQLRATEQKNTTHVGMKDIYISLHNLNDELPIFDKNSPSSVNVSEDVQEHALVAKVHATDRDIDDNVTHSLVGQGSLTIDEKTGEIFTKADALDYESMPTVIVQIVATDLALHKTYTVLTINVEDVNDVPPKLSLPKESPTLEEEVKIGTIVNATISATDIDTDPELKFSIDWANSRAQKGSVDVNESYYRGRLEILTKEISKNQVEGTLNVAGRIDYENFDVIFLNISVTDKKTKHNENTTSALLTLYIKDINDNAPVFINPVNLMDVNENQVKNLTIGILTATDADGPQFNKVSYSIKPMNNTKDGLVFIDGGTGMIKVDKDKGIDAEEYEYLYYIVTATDGYLKTPINVSIYVNDLNDVVPELCDEKFNSTLYIPEKTDNGKFIVKIEGKDYDRESPFNNISYLINENYSAPMEYFGIGRFDGRITVNLTDGFILDRDRGPSEFTLNLKLRDNYIQDGTTWNTNSIDTAVKIILTDINDKEPVLPDLGDPASSVSENTDKDRVVLRVVADDQDDPKTNNTKVSYAIKNITSANGNYVRDESCKALFDVRTVEESIAEIFTTCHLRGYYGRWIIELYAEDRGTEPHGPLNYTRNYVIDVTDFNYDQPQILFPNTTKIPLRKDQTPHAPLRTYDNTLLNDFRADDKDHGDSGLVTFSLRSATGDHEKFEIRPISKNVAQLRQAQALYPNGTKYIYELTIVAKDGGNPPFNTTRDIQLMYAVKSGPSFENNTLTMSIKENKTGLDYRQKIPEASDMIGEHILPVYYFFMTSDDTKYFALNKSSREFTLKEELDREKQDRMIIHVVATPYEDVPPTNPLPESVLEITIIVLDVNDEAPVFNNKSYRAGVAMEDERDKLLLAVEAVDADLDDKLTYNIIPNSTTISNPTLNGVKDPFSLNTETGNLVLKFKVTDEMRGFFAFNISVHDAVNHTDTTAVWVHIAPQTYRIVFTFNNLRRKVEQEKTFVIATFTKTFGYLCVIDDIKNTLQTNKQVNDNVTAVTTHFVDSKDQELVQYDTIIRLSSEAQTISNLKAIFLANQLELLDVPISGSTDANNETEIVHWLLVSLTIFFFSCSITLLAVFIIKTKRLNQRLDKLAITRYGSQESDLDRIGKVPTTNQFAAAGSNPMWKTEKSFGDNLSQGSGGSDLIGIEDNPDFGYVNGAIMSQEKWQNSNERHGYPVFSSHEFNTNNQHQEASI